MKLKYFEILLEDVRAQQQAALENLRPYHETQVLMRDQELRIEQLENDIVVLKVVAKDQEKLIRGLRNDKYR